MSIFGNVNVNVDRGFISEGYTKVVFNTGKYEAEVKGATIVNSKSSAAKGVRVTFDVQGTEISETYWFMNKEGKSTYVNTEGKQILLSGARFLDDLARVVTGKSLNEMATSERYVDVFENGKRVPKMSTVMTDVLGAKVGVLIRKIRKNGREQVNNEWVDTNEVVFSNDVLTTFDLKTGRIGSEIIENKEPEFVAKWLSNNGEDKVIDRYKALPGLSSAPDAAKSDLPF